MDLSLARVYSNLTNQLENYSNIIPKDLIASFRSYTETIYKSELQHDYSEPVPWIGMYIALASLVCILLMLADVLHGFRNRIRWFPTKYFSLNAASLSMIAVAIKIPMDLTNLMPTRVDQATKIGSMAFMCTMMVNSLPSLAGMTSDAQLVGNIVALGVLVITLVVNVCLQIHTGVVSYPNSLDFDKSAVPLYADQNKVIASIYVAMLLFLLVIYTSSALAISELNRVLEHDYKAGQEYIAESGLDWDISNDVSKLKLHVRKYWIMAETVIPDFVIFCSATSTASGVICVLSTVLFTVITFSKIINIHDHDSDYKWSIPVIVLTQYTGVILGTVAPVLRCFAPVYFELSKEEILRNYLNVFEVGRHWTKMLSDWRGLAIRPSNPKWYVIISVPRYLILSVCVWFQKSIVVAGNIVALIPRLFRLSLAFLSLLSNGFRETEVEDSLELSNFVLRPRQDWEDTCRNLKQILEPLNHMIKKGESRQPKNLMKLLEKSTSFEGIENLYKQHSFFQSFIRSEYIAESWSLSLVTMTAIAFSLPGIPVEDVESLRKGVSEGLAYITLVEERLNTATNYVAIREVAKKLWQEVEVRRCHKWFQKVKNLDRPPVMNTTRQILEWLKNTSNNIFTQEEIKADYYTTIYAAYMHDITEPILLSYQDDIDNVSQETLFDLLSSLVSELLAACLTSLPRVIALKCETNTTLEREANVRTAARLLGETTQVINFLKDRNVPRFNDPNNLAFLGEWRKHFRGE